MANLLKCALMSLALAAAGSSHAALVAFDDLLLPNGSVFTGPYTESGFTVAKTGGDVFVDQVSGVTAALGTGSLYGGGNNGMISFSNPAPFLLFAFDLSGIGGTVNFEVTGFLGPTQIYQLGGSVTGSFSTVAASAGLITTAIISWTATGTSSSVDNFITSTPVPEPETYAMLLAGLGMLGYTRRKKLKAHKQKQ